MKNISKKAVKRDKKNVLLILGIILLVLGSVGLIISGQISNFNLLVFSIILSVAGLILLIVSLFNSFTFGWRMFYKQRPKYQDPY